MKKYTALLAVIGLLVAGLGMLQAQDQNIVEIASGDEQFSTLVTAVDAAGLVDVLADPEASWTVFAPTNAAFEALPDGTLDMLLSDTELLTRVLTYHVVEGVVTSDQLSNMMAPSMEMTAPGEPLQGSELNVTVADDGTVMVNDANVIAADIMASNGVIHVIDSVLVPAEIAEMMSGDEMAMQATEEMSDDMMMDDMSMEATLYGTLNPADLADDAIVTLASDLSEITGTFDGFEGITNVQSINFTSDGSAYFTADVENGQGTIVVVDGFTGAEPMAVGMGSRMIGGEGQAGLVSPKGIEIVDSMDLVLVANFGANNIKGFPLGAEGDAAPSIFIDDLGSTGGSVWEVLYVESLDTLFAAGTAGDVLAYDNFSADMGATTPRVIAPSNADGEKVTINLHGLAYDEASDTLIVTDVGAADDATDGHIYAVPGASMASGNVTVSLHILGPDSMLGNPVDVAFDGSGLYVAEKANGAFLYFDGLLDMTGMMDSTPTSVLEAANPESLALVGDMMMGDMDGEMEMDMEATEEMGDMDEMDMEATEEMMATEEADMEMDMEATEESN